MCVPKLRFKADDGSEFPEWEERRLGDVCDIVGGGTPDTEKSEYWNEDINWFTPSEIGTTKYAVKSSRQISKLGILKSSAKLLPRGTILLTSRATLGEMAITRQECCTNQGFQSLIIKPGYLNEFIYYCQSVIKKYCKKHASGSTFLEIGKKEISECKLGIPSLPEQRKIAAFLSAIDTQLELSKSELSKWEQFKKGMLQKIFRQEVRFRAEDGSMYPEWEEKRLGEVFFLVRGQVLPVAEMKECPDEIYCYPVYSSQTKNNGIVGFYKNYLYKNAITWTTDGANAGTVKFRKGKFYCTNVCGVLINTDKNPYANECIAEMINYISHKYVYKAGNPKLMNNVMADMIIKFPSLPEQKKIADLFSSIDQMIELSKQEVEYWESYKKGLLQQMFV